MEIINATLVGTEIVNNTVITKSPAILHIVAPGASNLTSISVFKDGVNIGLANRIGIELFEFIVPTSVNPHTYFTSEISDKILDSETLTLFPPVHQPFTGILLVDSQLLVSCDNVITLTANIIGSITDRSINWSQIKGTPVTFLESTNQLSTTFTQTTIRDDKVFRFTIDGETINSVHSDVLVTAVPLEVCNVSMISGSSIQNDYITSETAQNISFIPGFSPVGQATTDNVNYMLVWNSLRENYLTSYSLGIKQPNGSFLYTNIGLVNYVTPVQLNKEYNISSLLDYHGVLRTGYSNKFITQSASINVLIDASDSVSLNNNVTNASNSQQILEIFIRELISTDTNNEICYIANYNLDTSSQSVLDSLERSLITTETPEENSLIAIFNNGGNQSILQVLTTGITSLG